MHTVHHALQSVSKDKLIAIVMKARCGKLVGMRTVEMSKEEIKYEIGKVLDQFSDKALTELLFFLKELDSRNVVETSINSSSSLNKILAEDKELLAKLAQ